MELVTGNVYKVDKDTDILTEAEISKYADQVREADRVELKQFLKNSVSSSDIAHGFLINATWSIVFGSDAGKMARSKAVFVLGAVSTDRRMPLRSTLQRRQDYHNVLRYHRL